MYNGQADYWWLRSPYLYHDGNLAYYVIPGGGVDNVYDWSIDFSYGWHPALISIHCSCDSCNFMYQYVFFHLITLRAFMQSIMPGMCIQMETLIMHMIIHTIPTGVYFFRYFYREIIEFLVLLQKGGNFHSYESILSFQFTKI